MTLSATVLYMSMSLDGFIAGPNEGPDNGLERLHDWAMPGGGGVEDVDAVRRSGSVNGKVIDEFMSTGAVVAGRGTFEPAGGWGGDHHDGVPIFIVARDKPGIDISQWPLVTYVNDVTTTMTRAKEAAGDKNVWSTASEPPASHSPPVSLTRSNYMSSRCSSAKGAACSRTWLPSRLSLSAPGFLKVKTVSPTCATGSSAEVPGCCSAERIRQEVIAWITIRI